MTRNRVIAFLESFIERNKDFMFSIDDYISKDLWVEFPTRSIEDILNTYHKKLEELDKHEPKTEA